jgi:hypothetical protein
MLTNQPLDCGAVVWVHIRLARVLLEQRPMRIDCSSCRSAWLAPCAAGPANAAATPGRRRPFSEAVIVGGEVSEPTVSVAP